MSARAPDAGSVGGARAVAVLPARLASTRIARKMLLDAGGVPLIVHSARNVLESGVFARVVVATDAKEIAEAARVHGIEAVMTRADHPSGTDRVNECFTALRSSGETARVVVGVQGDEPELAHADLARLVGVFADGSVEMATLAAPLSDPAQLASQSVVKVVCDARGDALYFSRASIPAQGHGAASTQPVARKHVGVYAFRPDALARFCTLPRGVLEVQESLEQLRWLEHGGKLRVVDVAHAPHGIDTPADYDAFVARVRARAGGSTSDARRTDERSSVGPGPGQRTSDTRGRDMRAAGATDMSWKNTVESRTGAG